ncbi:MAG: Rne/Rng family ribonuclease [Hyphomicrobiales bacterium]|nr:Rne/Rng family ribonuclease [Hyphomicrobiales bacterium]
MANKMLVDAAHPEETRVVVLRGNRVQEFDFEAANRKQLRGNIYLAKVTRVEPSLQAAFVDYGGNRHGFLAFSEIHPDYYQIPVADRQALIEAENEEIADTDPGNGETNGKAAAAAGSATTEQVSEPAATTEVESPEPPVDGTTTPPDAGAQPEAAANAAPEVSSDGDVANDEQADTAGDDDVASDDQVDSVGAEDALEEVPERRRPRPRQYKIQEVIKRRQVLLVQVVKEERGNKGAALTTYLSLAGRYSVLMPNTARGGGISRKITSPADRKRLKEVVSDLEVPEGMGVILRTAGASRTRAEVKRDFEYLLRLWENVRELTLHSTAPTLVYEEGSLIKRSIRDLYSKEIDEILVSGDEDYREAKDFMRMLMPSHAKNVKPYRDDQPLFARWGIEAQLDAMFSPQVTLRSGGYLVINQTEALVAIDVNSGRATREHNIEDTALQTNLEAADEVARQLRLRDLAGLIVIDFIDMEEKRNNRAVERKMKEALKNDRARIQVGRISHFGLLEMSRQRIRTGVLESTTSTCSVCQGSGHVRAPSSVALHVLRSLEDQLLKGATHNLIIRTQTPVALYILNQKRAHLSDLERRFGLSVAVHADEGLANGAHFAVERTDPAERAETARATVQPDSVQPSEDEPVEEKANTDAPVNAEAADEPRSNEDGPRRRRRRRRRGGGDNASGEKTEMAAVATESAGETGEPDADGEKPDNSAEATGEDDEQQPRKRRRGRRGGRRGRRGRGGEAQAPSEEGDDAAIAAESEVTPPGGNGVDTAAELNEAYRDSDGDPESGTATKETVDSTIPVKPAEPDTSVVTTATDIPEAEPAIEAAETPASETAEAGDEWEPIAPGVPTPATKKDDEPDKTSEPEQAEPIARQSEAPSPAPAPSGDDEDADKPKRSGWWQRSFF